MEAEEEEGTRSFTRALESIADGDLVTDAGSEMHRLLKDLRQEGLKRHSSVKGTLTLKLTFVVEPGGLVEIRPAITTKTADRQLSKGVLWLTPGANLSPSNPRQQNLPLREVGGVENVREIDGDGREAREV